jgi:hypothetical protein
MSQFDSVWFGSERNWGRIQDEEYVESIAETIEGKALNLAV